MIAAVDISVLLDVFLPDDRHGEQSKQRLRAACDAGGPRKRIIPDFLRGAHAAIAADAFVARDRGFYSGIIY